MADFSRLIVLKQGYTHPDPQVDARFASKAGDIVAVMPDNYVPHKKVKPPKFEIVRVEGLFSEQQYLTEPAIEAPEDKGIRFNFRRPEEVSLVLSDFEPALSLKCRHRWDDASGSVIDRVKIKRAGELEAIAPDIQARTHTQITGFAVDYRTQSLVVEHEVWEGTTLLLNGQQTFQGHEALRMLSEESTGDLAAVLAAAMKDDAGPGEGRIHSFAIDFLTASLSYSHWNPRTGRIMQLTKRRTGYLNLISGIESRKPGRATLLSAVESAVHRDLV